MKDFIKPAVLELQARQTSLQRVKHGYIADAYSKITSFFVIFSWNASNKYALLTSIEKYTIP